MYSKWGMEEGCTETDILRRSAHFLKKKRNRISSGTEEKIYNYAFYYAMRLQIISKSMLTSAYLSYCADSGALEIRQEKHSCGHEIHRQLCIMR